MGRPPSEACHHAKASALLGPTARPHPQSGRSPQMSGQQSHGDQRPTSCSLGTSAQTAFWEGDQASKRVAATRACRQLFKEPTRQPAGPLRSAAGGGPLPAQRAHHGLGMRVAWLDHARPRPRLYPLWAQALVEGRLLHSAIHNSYPQQYPQPSKAFRRAVGRKATPRPEHPRRRSTTYGRRRGAGRS